jgi:hypothetical protein
MEQDNKEQIVPTADQVEEVMLKKEEQNASKEGHILDTYAGQFSIYGPVFDRHINALNKKGLVRLLKLLVKYPLEEGHLKPLGKVERDAFNIGDKLLVSKYVMLIHSFAEMSKKENDLKILRESADKKVEPELNVTIEGEDKNG